MSVGAGAPTRNLNMHQRHVNDVLRTPEEIRNHYLAEKELARQLRSSMPEQRAALYVTVYEELFRRVPSHPILFRTVTPMQRQKAIRWQLQFLRRFLKPSHAFLEIGAGDCALALAVAKMVAKVYAVDVSAKLTESITPPDNFELRLSDGCSVEVPDNTVDVAYSNQLMEHLHPDDALLQVREVYRALKPGGVYVCVTPNRLGGPYDISRHFDTVATGLHLKEYTVTESSDLFRSVGFARVRAYVGARGFYLGPPLSILRAVERVLEKLQHGVRQEIFDSMPLRPFMMIRLVGTKV
jgi:SAM-dependent methyltransferase